MIVNVSISGEKQLESITKHVNVRYYFECNHFSTQSYTFKEIRKSLLEDVAQNVLSFIQILWMHQVYFASSSCQQYLSSRQNGAGSKCLAGKFSICFVSNLRLHKIKPLF